MVLRYLVGIPSAAVAALWLQWGLGGVWVGMSLGNAVSLGRMAGDSHTDTPPCEIALYL